MNLKRMWIIIINLNLSTHKLMIRIWYYYTFTNRASTAFTRTAITKRWKNSSRYQLMPLMADTGTLLTTSIGLYQAASNASVKRLIHVFFPGLVKSARPRDKWWINSLERRITIYTFAWNWQASSTAVAKSLFI